MKYSVSEIYSGGTPDGGNSEYWADDEPDSIPWVTIRDMTRGPIVSYTERRITPAGLTSKRLRVLPKGTLLYSMYASLGKVAILGVPAAVNQAILGIVPDTRKSNQGFLKYWLIQMEQRLELFSSSNTQDNINAGKVRGMPLVIPRLDEQQQITDFLDRKVADIDELIGKKMTLIERLKEKRAALIYRAVTRGLPPAEAAKQGFPVNPDVKPSGYTVLGDIPGHWKATKTGRYVSILSGFAFPSSGFSYDDSDTKLLRGTNVGVSAITWGDTVHWSRQTGDGLGEFELKGGDLVIGMDRPWISDGVRVAVVSEEDLPCLLLQRVAAIRTSPLLVRDYLFRILSSPIFVNHFTPDMTGVSVPHISPTQICDLPIPLPSVPEQLAITAYLDQETTKLDALTASAGLAIERLQEYRSAIITAAVTGKIDVRRAAK